MIADIYHIALLSKFQTMTFNNSILIGIISFITLLQLISLSNSISIPFVSTEIKEESYKKVDEFTPAIIPEGFPRIGLLVYHGMGDSGLSEGIQSFSKAVAHEVGQYISIRNVVIGDSDWKDRYNSFFMPIKEQIETVCQEIRMWNKQDNINEWHAIGLSQGAQFLRAIVQTCDDSHITKLISIGGQHEGIYGAPHCSNSNVGFIRTLCGWIGKALQWSAYETSIQKKLVQAQYWHNPLNPTEYIMKCSWLPQINNYSSFELKYKLNLTNLKALVLIKFNQDEMVSPKESSHFEFYEENNDELKIIPLRQSKLYIDDLLGLKELDENGKLFLLSVDGNHLRFKWQWFVDEVIPILKM